MERTIPQPFVTQLRIKFCDGRHTLSHHSCVIVIKCAILEVFPNFMNETLMSKNNDQNILLRAINTINNFVALKITLVVSSIWAFYIFVLYGLAPLIWPSEEINILYWTNFLQLIFLPIITVGATILGRKAEERARRDHEHLTKNFIMTHKMLSLMQDFHEVIFEHTNENHEIKSISAEKKQKILRKSQEVEAHLAALNKENSERINPE